jgi:hypothetical protein
MHFIMCILLELELETVLGTIRGGGGGGNKKRMYFLVVAAEGTVFGTVVLRKKEVIFIFRPEYEPFFRPCSYPISAENNCDCGELRYVGLG